MAQTMGVLSRLKQPEYTGENRCMPCTVVNTVIAAVVSVVVAAVAWQLTAPTVAGGLGVAVFVASGAAIYFRGYLVPGTPELTKQYFPEWLLAAFGKAPEQPAAGVARAEDAGESSSEPLDPETALVSAGALEECQGGADLCLTDGFRSAWYDAIDELKAEDADRDRLLDLLEVEGTEVEVEEFGEAFRAMVDDRPAGTWQSEAAYLADLGAGTILAERYERWDDLAVGQRGRLLNGLRLFIDRCPTCDGTPDFGTETVESCCTTHEVAAVECEDCGARLFETRT